MSKRKIQSSYEEEEFTIDDFKNSASYFGENEEKALNIIFSETTDFTEIIDFKYCNTDIDYNLKELLLNNFNKDSIIVYNSNKNKNLSKNQKKFLNKLRDVLINNDPSAGDSNFEEYIDELMKYIYDIADFDDGENLLMKPCNLRFNVEEYTFAAKADRMGMRGNEIIWVLCEDKHRKSKTYKKGEIQLVTSILSAFQENRNILDEIYPKKIIGIRVSADKVDFYSIKADEKYLNSLYSGLPIDNLYVHKYLNNDLYLSSPSGRYNVFKFLTYIKNYALSLEIKDIY